MIGKKIESVQQIALAVREQRVSAQEIIARALDRIEELDRELGAFITVDAEGAMTAAENLDRSVRVGKDPGLLAGVPIAIKDNFSTRGLKTTCGSKMLSQYVSPYDATAVSRLRRAGAVIVGKTNMDEFGMGSSGEYSAFRRTLNPIDPSRVPGGSSSGSAAAVASGMVPAALGSDTGGSVRQPASMCGVTGMKPTYGRVSRYGLVAFASSLDTPGPICSTVDGCARMLNVMAGSDGRDMTAIGGRVPDFVAGMSVSFRDLKIGVAGFWEQYADEDVVEIFEGAVDGLCRLGVSISKVELPHAEQSVAAYCVASSAEASSNLARFDGVRYGLRVAEDSVEGTYVSSRESGFGVEVKRRILLGTFVLSEGYKDMYYERALAVRRNILDDFQMHFDRGVDLVALPTSPFPAFELGRKINDPLSMYRADVCTLPASLAGLPSISVPCGLNGDGLPVGLQLVGCGGNDALVLAAAHAFEGVSMVGERCLP